MSDDQLTWNFWSIDVLYYLKVFIERQHFIYWDLGCTVNFPSAEYLILIPAGHVHNTCSIISSSSIIWESHILTMWCPSLQLSISSPTGTFSSNNSTFSSLCSQRYRWTFEIIEASLLLRRTLLSFCQISERYPRLFRFLIC